MPLLPVFFETPILALNLTFVQCAKWIWMRELWNGYLMICKLNGWIEIGIIEPICYYNHQPHLILLQPLKKSCSSKLKKFPTWKISLRNLAKFWKNREIRIFPRKSGKINWAQRFTIRSLSRTVKIIKLVFERNYVLGKSAIKILKGYQPSSSSETGEKI